MQAGAYMQLFTGTYMNALMERVQFDIVGKTIEQGRIELSRTWQPHDVDYSRFELPTYESNPGR